MAYSSVLLSVLVIFVVIEGMVFDQTFESKWKKVFICKIYNFFDGSGCHPCLMQKCLPPRVKAFENCKVYTCDLSVVENATFPAITSKAAATTTTTSPISTRATRPM